VYGNLIRALGLLGQQLGEGRQIGRGKLASIIFANVRGEVVDAAIDELRRKGPGYRRDISLWGQVGEGALALGCIAAAVTGQVEFGLPCVIGGAATSAALRVWDGQK